MSAKKTTTKKKKSSAKSRPKKVSPSVEPKSEPLFIGVPDPENVRMSILETSKTLLVVLKKMELIKGIRSEKQESLAAIVVLVKEIKSSILKLKKMLPASSILKSSMVNVEPLVKPANKPKKVNPVKFQSKTELEKLESELAMIESKLNSI